MIFISCVFLHNLQICLFPHVVFSGRLYESLRPLNTMLILVVLQHVWMERNKTNNGVKYMQKKEAGFEP